MFSNGRQKNHHPSRQHSRIQLLPVRRRSPPVPHPRRARLHLLHLQNPPPSLHPHHLPPIPRRLQILGRTFPSPSSTPPPPHTPPTPTSSTPPPRPTAPGPTPASPGAPRTTTPRRPDPTRPFLFRVEGAAGCECGGGCGGERCPCLGTERECGPGCGNRGSQGGVRVRLKVVRRDERKGWGLFADQLIARGQFVCEYAGELLSTKEARQRQQTYDKLTSNGRLTPALLVVKEHLPSGNVCMRINIDATRIGNVARFINHSCDGGNLDTVIIRSSGALLPRVCFFASRDIQENEELTFSYGDVRLEPNGQPCFCGTSSCAGILPSEHT